MVRPSDVPTVTLSDGVRMPLIGLGTSNVVGKVPGDAGYDAIKCAIECGYRFIDTAALYGNEEALGVVLGDCIREGLVTREELFICTKVWNTAHKRNSVMVACKQSLDRLKMDYADLYLIHWPVAYAEDGDPINPRDPTTAKLRYSDTHYTETWLGMEDCKDAGLVRSIGLSNFNHHMVDELLGSWPNLRHRPTVNQVECHPYLSQEKLLAYSKQKSIVLTAYCPLGSPDSCAKRSQQPPILEDSTVVELAKRHNKSPAQILIRYQVQRGVSVIPKSVSRQRIRENIEILDFELSPEDMARLEALNKNARYCIDTAGEFVHDHPLYPFNVDY